jgi:hypothetical protein
LGQEIVLTAVAGNDQGRDISNQIQWFDQAGELLGRGSTLTYIADQVVMETITAQVRSVAGSDSGSGTSLLTDPGTASRVSFTVSPEDVVLQPHVKVLADEAASKILSFDPEAGILELQDDPVLTTLYPGDVLYGADLRIPPVYINSLENLRGTLRLQIRPAFPREISKQGIITEWQEVAVTEDGTVLRLDPLEAVGLATGCNQRIQREVRIPIFSAPATTVGIEIANPWPEFFEGVASEITTALDVDAVGEVDLCAVYEPPLIEFKEEGQLFSGISRFEVAAGLSDVSARAFLEMNGLLAWGLSGRIPSEPLKLIQVPQFIVGQLGPVIIWLSFDVLGTIKLSTGVEIQVRDVRLGIGYSGGRFIQRIQYSDEAGWANPPADFSQGTFELIREGQFEIDGFIKAGLNPEIEPTLWGSIPPLKPVGLFVLPKIGVNVYLKADVDLTPSVEVGITAPANGSQIRESDEVTLNATASGDPAVTLFAGVDLTLRDGSVESCSGGQSVPGSGTTLLSLQTSNASCESWRDGLKSRTVLPRDDRYKYQIKVMNSDIEYLVPTGDGRTIWADGIKLSDCYLLDAKWPIQG